MKHKNVLLTTVLISIVLVTAGCAPHGGRGRMPKPLSANELFDKADSNKDGMLTKHELEVAMEQ